jgi:membrane protease YdiL (CAAX protease family)
MEKRGGRLADLGFVRPPLDETLLFVPAALLVVKAVSSVWGRIAYHFGIHLQPDGLKDYPAGWPGLALALVLGAVVAPITEEIFFRGFLFRGLRKYYPFWFSSGLSALAFAAVHLVPGAIVTIGAMGFLLAWLRERSGSIWPSIAMHMINNVIYFAMRFAEHSHVK